MTFDDDERTMTQYTIQMTFTELNPITEDDYLDDVARERRDRILMASYFRQVPEFDYINRTADGKTLETTPCEKTFSNGLSYVKTFWRMLVYFTEYKVQGDDRPDNVAFEIYGDETLTGYVVAHYSQHSKRMAYD